MHRKSFHLLIEDERAATQRWKQYFEELLNEKQCAEQTTYELSIKNIEIELDVPSIEEVKKATKKISNNKSPEKDEIASELIKYAGEKTLQELQCLLVKVWEKEKRPEEWGTDMIVPILKKGHSADCKNYRLI